MDNLEAQTYETFEKDIVKYSQVRLFYLASGASFLQFIEIFIQWP